MMDLKAILEKLQGELEENTNAIESLSEGLEQKEEEIKETDKMIILLESGIVQQQEKKDNLLKEYKDLVKEVKRRKATDCISTGINKLFAKDDSNEDKIDVNYTIERAEKIIEKEESMSQTRVMSGILNEYRRIERRTDINEEERCRLLLKLCDRMEAETNKLRDMIGK